MKNKKKKSNRIEFELSSDFFHHCWMKNKKTENMSNFNA